MTKDITPQALYPSRMTLDLSHHDLPRVSTLTFPYQQALDDFLSVMHEIDKKRNPARRYRINPPPRQLNDAFLTLAPGLVHGFEKAWENGQRISRMVALSVPRHNDQGDIIGYEVCPTTDQVADLVKIWLDLWIKEQGLTDYIEGEAKRAWEQLKKALKSSAETNWQHNTTLSELLEDTGHKGGLAFSAFPALITALLHGRQQEIKGANPPYKILWRRANDGGVDSLHLVSQPFAKDGDYFAYRMDFHLVTQTGHMNSQGRLQPWVHADLGIQRYITDAFKRDKIGSRNLSILVGYNREGFETPADWPFNSTLIRLGVKKPTTDEADWDDGVGQLLHTYGLRVLKAPKDILAAPQNFGRYEESKEFKDRDEYYPVFAEGRTFGQREHGRRHKVEVGLTLKEYHEIVEGAVEMLGGLLHVSEPFEIDGKPLKNKVPFALRSYEYMSRKRTGSMAPYQTAAQEGLQRVLTHIGKHKLHIVILHQSDVFRDAAYDYLKRVLLLPPNADESLATITDCRTSPLLFMPLLTDGLDQQDFYRLKGQARRDFVDKWNAQMSRSYEVKRDEWRKFLGTLGWEEGAYRMVLIDSLGDKHPDQKIHETQAIKGAVRDACHREQIASQFMIGGFTKNTPSEDAEAKPRGRGKANEELKGEVRGRLENSALDLLVRQTGLLYGQPCEVYEAVVRMPKEIASQLDIIAFCRLQKQTPKLHSSLAVRVSAGGCVDVMIPGRDVWVPYLEAARQIGRLFSDSRAKLNTNQNPLSMTQGQLADFVHDVLTKHIARPTIAVIEAEGWRNGRSDDEKEHCWRQLRNGDLMSRLDVLEFPRNRRYVRESEAVKHLLAVVRLRMNDETPQYITQDWHSEGDPFRDIPHLTGYVDTHIPDPLHFFSVAGLPETQKKQGEKRIYEGFKQDQKSEYDEMAIKHAQLVEMVPFFVRSDFKSDEGQRQICRAVHYSRVAPGFTVGEVLLPYAMHLGVTLLEDQLCIVEGTAF